MIGKPVAISVVAPGSPAGARIHQSSAYASDVNAEATVLSISTGHILATVATAVGGFNELSAEVASAFATATVIETDEIVDVSAPDQGGHHGGAANGAVATLAVLGGEMMSAFPWEFRILGTEGALMIRPVATGGMQIAQWDITLRELDGAIRKLEIPSSFTLVPDAVSTGAPTNDRHHVPRVGSCNR